MMMVLGHAIITIMIIKGVNPEPLALNLSDDQGRFRLEGLGRKGEV